MKLSAVVPNYNHGHLIANAIRSLAEQTLAFDEIIVVDDGSTDDSLSVLQSLASGNPRLRIIRHDRNRGAVAALNTGLHAAQGAYIHFGGADDYFAPKLAETTAALLDAYPEAALACGEVEVVDRSTGRSLGLRPAARPSNSARHFSPTETVGLLAKIDNFIVTPAALFRRDAVVNAGGFNGELGPFTDGYLVRQLALYHGFCFTPVPLATWQVDDGGYSRKLARAPEQAFQSLQRVKTMMASDRAFPEWYPDVFAKRYLFAIGRLAALAEPIDVAALRSIAGREAGWWVTFASHLPGWAGRLVFLVGLSLQFRPFSLPGLAATSLRRRLWRQAH
jgi:glycosyltransferase involved in cell wall biosynthesis